MLGPKAIHKHFIEMLKKDDDLDDITIRMMLYPIDKVEYDRSEQIFFYADNVLCFAVGPSYSSDNDLEEYFTQNNG